MPVALPQSLKDTVKLLVMQGVRDSLIAQETGVNRLTLKTWIKRYGWVKARDNAKEILNRTGTESLTRQVNHDLASLSQSARTKLAGHLVRGTENLDKLKAPTGLKSIRAHASAVNDLVQNASKVFGWGDENREVLVNVTMMSQPIPCGVLDQGVNDKVIDVDTTSDNPQ